MTFSAERTGFCIKQKTWGVVAVSQKRFDFALLPGG